MDVAKCRICNSENLQKFLSLGEQPLANSFLKEEQLNDEEERFPLGLCFCNNCKLTMLTHVVPPEKMFKRPKNWLLAKKDKGSLVVDIGSNDGILLRPFKEFGMRVIGVEPATNVAKIAESNGIETINDFFNENVVKKIIEERGNADVVTATNVFAHIHDISSFTKNIYSLLNDDGIFIIEIQYLADMLRKMTFDNTYHEHLSYLSLNPLVVFFKQHISRTFVIFYCNVSLKLFFEIRHEDFQVQKS